jgi:hypothetical protein
LRPSAAFVRAAIRWAAGGALFSLAVLPAALPGFAGDEPAAPRVEGRSASLLAVGIVSADRMSIHVTRVVDNAPVRDAVVTVLLRGVTHPTVAEADGSYTLQTNDLRLPGPATVDFQLAQGTARQELKGTLLVADGAAKPEDKNSARQLWWWVLNFAVCIGFLLLLARRRKASPPG